MKFALYRRGLWYFMLIAESAHRLTLPNTQKWLMFFSFSCKIYKILSFENSCSPTKLSKWVIFILLYIIWSIFFLWSSLTNSFRFFWSCLIYDWVELSFSGLLWCFWFDVSLWLANEGGKFQILKYHKPRRYSANFIASRFRNCPR